MKKIIALLLACAMIFALCAGCGSSAGDSGEKVIKIGVYEPLSGDSASGGKKEVLGMQYANQETPTIEVGGVTYKIELDISDGIPPCPESRGDDIVRIILRGETETAPDTAELQKQWEDNFFALQLRDRSTLRRELWEGSARDSLRGLFLRKMREKYDAAPSEAERQKITEALRWGLAALDGGEAVKEI